MQPLLQYYPASNDTQAEVSQLKLARDIIFGVQNYTWANTQSGLGGKAYVYRFVHRPPATGEYTKYGAFHTAEVPYAFNNLQFVNRPWKEEDRALADIMSSYWANFARTGNPNWKGLPVWEVYKKGISGSCCWENSRKWGCWKMKVRWSLCVKGWPEINN